MDNIVVIAESHPPYHESYHVTLADGLKDMGFDDEEIGRALVLLECLKKMIGD